MAQYQQRDNSFSVFKNDRKRDGKKDADWTGSAIVNGEAFWVDMWCNNHPRSEDYDPAKKTFFSGSFRPKDSAPHRQPKAADPTKRQYEMKPRHAPPPPLHQPPKSEKYKPAHPDDPNIPF